jgi:hypothetical protein
LSFIPLAAPCRLIDTRYTQYGVLGSPYLLAGVPRDFPVPLGACTAIPANAQAYSMNVTVVPHRTLTYLTMWPTGQPQPLVSTLNSFDGRIVANAAIVPAGTSGAISVYASDDTELIVDVNGYFADPASAPSGLVFYAQTPCRIADTRGIGFSGPFGAPYIPSGGSRSFPVLQSSCAPPSAPQAYSLNFTVLPRAGALQYLTVWPSGQTRPFASTLNSLNGQVVANAAIVGAGTGGAVSAYVTDAADLLIDTNGYFAAPGGAAALSFMKVTPCRIADTRFASAGALGLSATRTFDVIATQCGIPYTAQAYSMNITVVPLGPLGWLTVWPTGQPQPMVSTLNSFNGAVVANAAIVPAGTNGQIDVFASNPTHVIIDINGYFAP